VVLKHGALPAVDLPADTASYRIKDATLLNKLSEGDKVVFTLERTPTGPMVTRIEKKK
jgi:Cu/Ag efflux protein CusF